MVINAVVFPVPGPPVMREMPEEKGRQMSILIMIVAGAHTGAVRILLFPLIQFPQFVQVRFKTYAVVAVTAFFHCIPYGGG